jgi:transposase
MAWNLARGEAFLPNVSVQELKQRMSAEPNAKSKLRWLIAIHRKQGKSMDAVAEACAAPKPTVQSVLHRFQEKGERAAHAVKQEGRPPELTERQRVRLVKLLEKGNPRTPSRLWTSKEVLALIKREFGVSYTPQHVWRLLVASGFSLIQPRPRHYKSPSKEVQDAFKKKREESRGTTARKVLLWAARMKPRSGSSRTSRGAGPEKGAAPRLP